MQSASGETADPADDPGPRSCACADEPPGRGGAVVTVEDRSGRLGRAQLDWLADRAGAAARAAGVRGEIRMAVVDDAAMAAAHERWCGAAGTTDVITFDLAAGAAALGGEADADLLLCADEAARQAEARGIALEHELLLYALHGVLHCQGHDDGDERGYRRMHEREDEILAAIGVGRVFAAPHRDGVEEHRGR